MSSFPRGDQTRGPFLNPHPRETTERFPFRSTVVSLSSSKNATRSPSGETRTPPMASPSTRVVPIGILELAAAAGRAANDRQILPIRRPVSHSDVFQDLARDAAAERNAGEGAETTGSGITLR